MDNGVETSPCRLLKAFEQLPLVLLQPLGVGSGANELGCLLEVKMQKVRLLR